jgi:pimeloyl-ACP methyl ester carboxylesterase
MEQVTSADGTPIAFERFGDGPPLIVVGGALTDRASTRPLAERLGDDFAVINYDRRGRGDSGEATPYAVEREVEDLRALLVETGGTASVYGHSSGAALVLHAAAAALPIAGLVLHEPPFGPGSEEERRVAQAYARELAALLGENRRGDAVELFMTMVGTPTEMVAQMRAGPWWPTAEEIAPTLAHDSEVMGDRSRGGAIPVDLLDRITTTAPALVLCGGASPAWMIETGRRVTEALPNGQLRVLEGQGHGVLPDLLAPVLAEFLIG